MVQLLYPVADEILIALRRAFSLTFPRNPFIDEVQVVMMEIQRIGDAVGMDVAE